VTRRASARISSMFIAISAHFRVLGGGPAKVAPQWGRGLNVSRGEGDSVEGRDEGKLLAAQ